MNLSLSSDDPIIACSSGLGQNVAISVIRLSGFINLNFLESIISLPISKIKARYAHFVEIKDAGKTLDEGLLFFYPAPNSYNGENILELNIHGNILNVERIIDVFLRKGFRYAEPGEFSYRALKNGKLSLSQIEGLDLFLNASSPLALEQGFSLLNGELQKAYENLYQSFLNHKSALELGIDFLDDVGEEAFDKNFKESFQIFEKNLLKFKSRIENESSQLISPDIVLLGRPNSGKSTFFNSLLNFERSIVSDEEGTTRDYVTERIKINNVFYNLIDTAGLRESNNKIESIGINKTQERASKAFFRILLVNPFDKKLEQIKNYLSFPLDLIIFTHEDLPGFLKAYEGIKEIFGPIEPLSPDGPIEPTKTGPIEPLSSDGPIEPKTYCCFLDVNNVNSSTYSLVSSFIAKKFALSTQEAPILLDRQKQCLQELIERLADYKQILSIEEDISILSSELNILGHCISELIGIVSPDDVLHNIFSNFCIGK